MGIRVNTSGLHLLGLVLVLTVLAVAGEAVGEPGCRLNSDCPLSMACDGSLNEPGRCVSLPPLPHCEVDTGCECRTSNDCYLDVGVFTEDTPGGVCDLARTCILPDCTSSLECAIGEVCSEFACRVDLDADRDRDGVPDGSVSFARDNCPNQSNPAQRDHDRDGLGDVCDEDDDNDGVPDVSDNCPFVVNPSQLDREDNGVGDACEGFRDRDGDGVPDHIDNCTFRIFPGIDTFNPGQRDTDGDGIGDVCDLDDDNDGTPDIFDPCPVTVNIACFLDSDGDGLADAEDPFAAPLDLIEATGGRIFGFDPSDPNQPPSAIGFTTDVDENAGVTPLGLVLVSDPDEGDTHTFAITGGNGSGLFGIDAVGAVSTTGSLNFEASPQHLLTVTVADVGGLTDSTVVTVNVLNVNEPPSVSGFTVTVDENSPADSIGIAPVSDPDAGDTLSVAITSGNAAELFKINNVGLVATVEPLDFEAASLYLLGITVTDAGGLTDTATVTVKVRDLPEFSDNANLSGLSVSAAALVPVFQTTVLNYTASVPSTVAETTITPTLDDTNASVTVNGASVASGSPSASINLAEGLTTITIVVTAEDESTTQPYVVAITREAAALVPVAQLLADDGVTNDLFGWSVAVDGDTAIVGANKDDSRNGGAYIFVRAADGTWSQQAKLQEATGTGEYGFSVAIDGDIAVVGAYLEGFSGEAYVHSRTGTSWSAGTALSSLTVNNCQFCQQFGRSVAVSGSTIVVGSIFDGGSGNGQSAGAAYVFQPNGSGGWEPDAGTPTTVIGTTTTAGMLTASIPGTSAPETDGAPFDAFGSAVSVDGDTIVIGAENANSTGEQLAIFLAGDGSVQGNGTGAAYVFERSGGLWSVTQKLQSGLPIASVSKFGHSVDVQGNRAIVGAFVESVVATNAEGAAYVFERLAPGQPWGAGFRLAPTTAFAAFAGTSVAINGTNALVGAPGANRAYLYNRDASGWGTPQELSTSSTGNFGQSVDAAANVFLVGATAPGAGLAFVFTPPSP